MEAVARSINGESAPQPARILLVAPSARGGLAQQVISLLDGLHREGYHVGVACDPHGPIAAAARQRALPVCEIAISSGTSPSRVALAAAHLARAMGRLRTQIIHTHSFGATVVGVLAARLARGASLLLTIHNYPPGAQAMRPRRADHRWALRLAFRYARKIITVSEALRRDLLTAHPQLAHKSITIPNGVDTRAALARDPAATRAALGLSPEGPLVGMVARLAPHKGIPEFIRAARLVADALPSVQLVLAGDGPLRRDAHSLHQELDLGHRLRLLGEIESGRELIAALDLLVIPSTSEASSLVAMEAMAFEKPVVATSVGGLPEVVGDGETGLLVRPGDPQALAHAVLTLLRDPERAREMGQRGHRRALAHFDVHQMLELTEAVYADLLRENLQDGGVST